MMLSDVAVGERPAIGQNLAQYFCSTWAFYSQLHYNEDADHTLRGGDLGGTVPPNFLVEGTEMPLTTKTSETLNKM